MGTPDSVLHQLRDLEQDTNSCKLGPTEEDGLCMRDRRLSFAKVDFRQSSPPQLILARFESDTMFTGDVS